MSVENTNNKRIAKNAMLLYCRMIILMFVSLYTSRVILSVLGVEDYGIYNVVGGVVTMAGIIVGSLSASCSRFITFSLGINDIEYQRKVFSSSIMILGTLSIILAIVLEVGGVWFLNNKMNIPDGRLDAANVVLQCTIITFIINLLSVPYNSAIIAHEQMSVYAYVSIIEVVLRLAVVLALYILPFDKLYTYAFLLLVVSIIVRFIYSIYCVNHFKEAKFNFVYDKQLLKEMFSFAGWSFVGCSAQTLLTQGVNVITNVFFNVTLNAARGVAMQVDIAVRQFVNNFMTAIKPQITKSYASNDIDYMLSLIYSGAKYSFFLVLFFALPVLFEAEYILFIWLKNVPDYSALFVRWTILIILADVLSETIITANAASGKIKKYQLIVGGFNMTIFPITYFCFELGLPAVSSYIIHFSIFLANLFVRIKLMRDIIPITYIGYVRYVLLRIIPVSLISSILPYLLVTNMDDGVSRFLLICLLVVLELPMLIFFIGLNISEQRFIKNVFLTFYKKNIIYAKITKH